MQYKTQALTSAVDRTNFSCSNEILDTYFRTQASQDIKKRVAMCYVSIDVATDLVRGFYTLSNCSILSEDVPEEVRKRFPKSYESLPTTLISRLAIDQDHQGQGLGQTLLVDAMLRCLDITKTLGSIAVVVDPIDENAVTFYQKYGFILLPGSGRMFLPMKTIKSVFAK